MLSCNKIDSQVALGKILLQDWQISYSEERTPAVSTSQWVAGLYKDLHTVARLQIRITFTEQVAGWWGESPRHPVRTSSSL